MKKIYSQAKIRILNMPLSKKIICVYLFAGLLPLCMAFFGFSRDMRKSSLEKQQYAMNQNYNQAHQTLSDQISRMKEIVTMIVINKDINEAFRDGKALLPLYEQVRLFRQVEKYTKSIVKTSNLEEIIFYIDSSYIMAGYDVSKIFQEVPDGDQELWYQSLMKNPTERLWMLTPQSRNQDELELSLYRALWSMDDFQKIVGIVSVSYDYESMERLLTPAFPGQKLFLWDEFSGQIVGVNKRTVDMETMRRQLTDGEFTTIDGRDGYSYRLEPISDTGIYLVSVVSVQSIYGDADILSRRMLVVSFLINMILLALIITVSKLITRRITLLDSSMEHVQQGEFQLVSLGDGRDEIGRLIENYNYMITEINYLLEQQYRMGQENKNLELRALQSQINPHFLYNTLELISWMAVKNETHKIRQIVRQLSIYYKLVLNRGEDIVTIEHEMNLCINYMDIQMCRFKGRIDFSIEADPKVKEALIPKITLQPLLENAIFHGINQKLEGRGKIQVTITLYNDRIRFNILDDGIGFQTEERIGEATTGSKYGLRNIEERLNLFFNQPGSIVIESTPGLGTCVIIDIPYKEHI